MNKVFIACLIALYLCTGLFSGGAWAQRGKQPSEFGQNTAQLKYMEDLCAKARKGDADAQYKLACCYDMGKGVRKDETAAALLYLEAAKQGHAEAQYSIGHCYSMGIGVPKNKKEAGKWIKQAAEQGSGGAQLRLAFDYDFGQDGFPVDEKEAVKWYKKAADQGYKSAKVRLRELGVKTR
ncbi:sel1 repeat family protein [bacterium]|nr:sel1 repeat family protein [bacterium]